VAVHGAAHVCMFCTLCIYDWKVAVWLSGSGIACIDEVTLCSAGLVLTSTTQPGHPW